MAYVNPANRSAGELITAARWNQDVVANIQALKSPPLTRTSVGTVAVTSTTFVPLIGTQNIITTTGGRVLCVAYGHAYVDDGSGPQRFFVQLQQDGNYVIVTNEGIVNGFVTGGSFQATPWAIMWMTSTLTPAFHTFRLYGRVTGGTVQFWVTQFWMLEV